MYEILSLLDLRELLFRRNNFIKLESELYRLSQVTRELGILEHLSNVSRFSDILGLHLRFTMPHIVFPTIALSGITIYA